MKPTDAGIGVSTKIARELQMARGEVDVALVEFAAQRQAACERVEVIRAITASLEGIEAGHADSTPLRRRVSRHL